MDLRDFVQRMAGSYPQESTAAWASALEAPAPASRQRLLAVLEELRRCPVAEFILESARLRCSDPDTDSGHRRLREAMAAAVAVSRVLTYLTKIDTLNTQRELASREIAKRKARGDSLLHADLDAMVRELVACHQLSGEIEINIHLIAICAQHISTLLPIAARPTGHKLSPDDRRVLHQFDGLRDYFEHLEERLPGKSRQAEIVREIDDEAGWGLEVGFRIDAEGRIVIGSATYAVDTATLAHFDLVARATVIRIRTSAFGEVVQYFTANPERIPDASTIRRKPMMSLGFDFEGGIRA